MTWSDEVKKLREHRAFVDAWAKLVDGLRDRDAFATDAWLDHIVGRFVDSRTVAGSGSSVIQPGFLFWPAMRQLLENGRVSVIEEKSSSWLDTLLNAHTDLPTPTASIEAAFSIVAAAASLAKFEPAERETSTLEAELGQHFHESVQWFAGTLGVATPSREGLRLPRLSGDVEADRVICSGQLSQCYAASTDDTQLPVSMALRAFRWVLGLDADHSISTNDENVHAWALLTSETVDCVFPTTAKLVLTSDEVSKPSLLYPDPIHIGVIAFDKEWTDGFIRAAKYVAKDSGTTTSRSYRWRLQFLATEVAGLVASACKPKLQSFQRSYQVSGSSATALMTALLAVADSHDSWDPRVTCTGGMTDDGRIESVDILPKLAPALWEHAAHMEQMAHVAVHGDDHNDATQALLAKRLSPIHHVKELINLGRVRKRSRRKALLAAGGTLIGLGAGVLIGRGSKSEPRQPDDAQIATVAALFVVAGLYEVSEEAVFDAVLERVRQHLPQNSLSDQELRELVASAFRARAEELQKEGVRSSQDLAAILVAADKNRDSLSLQVQAGEEVFAAFSKHPIHEWKRRAAGYFEWALQLAEKDSVHWADLANTYTRLLSDLGRHRDALPVAEQVLRVYQDHGEGKAARAASAMNNVAQFLEAAVVPNRDDRVMFLTRSAIRIGESCSPIDKDVPIYLNNLSQSLKARGKNAAAELVLRRAIAVDQYGPIPSLNGIRLGNLGMILLRTGRKELAGSFLRAGLFADEQRHAPNHPNVARRLRALGDWAKECGRKELSVPLAIRALAIFESAMGPASSEATSTVRNLAIAVLPSPHNRGLFRRVLELELAASSRYLADAHRELAQVLGPKYPREVTSLRREVLRLDAQHQETVSQVSRDLNLLLKTVGDAKATQLQDLQSLLTSGPEDGSKTAKPSSKGELTATEVLTRVNRILDPVEPVPVALADFDRRLEPWYLKIGLPIAGQIASVLDQSPGWRDNLGTFYAQREAWADALVEHDEALRLLTEKPNASPLFKPDRQVIELNRATARVELGLAEDAKKSLLRLLPIVDARSPLNKFDQWAVRFLLAKCQLQLGHVDSSKQYLKEAQQYSDPDALSGKKTSEFAEVIKENNGASQPESGVRGHARQLLQARDRQSILRTLLLMPLSDRASPVIDKVLDEGMSLEKALGQLDAQYRKDQVSTRWYDDVSKPISPHIDKLFE